MLFLKLIAIFNELLEGAPGRVDPEASCCLRERNHRSTQKQEMVAIAREMAHDKNPAAIGPKSSRHSCTI